jgi:hypothetical protein
VVGVEAAVLRPLTASRHSSRRWRASIASLSARGVASCSWEGFIIFRAEVRLILIIIIGRGGAEERWGLVVCWELSDHISYLTK